MSASTSPTSSGVRSAATWRACPRRASPGSSTAMACERWPRESRPACLTRGCDNRVRRFLRDHVNRADDEQPRRAREDGGIDDAQAFRLMDPEVAREHAALVLRTDRARARRVVAPRVIADELPQIRVAGASVARELFFGDQIRPHA